MTKMTPHYKQYNFLGFYLLPISIIWLTGLVFLIAKGYNESFLILNSYHADWLDLPMLVLTMLGDAGFMAVALLFIFISKQPYRLSLFILAIIVSGVTVQLLKYNVFNDWHRPPYLFKEQVHTVANYLLYHHSFPSGHSTTVAAVFTMLAWFRREHKTEIIIYAFVCPVIAYTRIYLGIHFLGDVVAGMLFGFSCSMLIVFMIKPFELKLKPWLVVLLKVASVIAAIVILTAFFSKYL